MDLTRLRHIVAAADANSISRAAEQMAITQPALSRSIAAFEAKHGVRLFDRTTSGVTPTVAGHLVIEQARSILFAAGSLEDSLLNYKNGKLSQIFIGFRPLLASMIAPKLTASMLTAGLAEQIFISIGSPSFLTKQLLEDRLEVCFGNKDQFLSPDLTTSKVGGIPFGLVVRSGHPLQGRKNLRIEDLVKFPIADSSHRFGEYFLNIETPGVICDNHDILRTVTLTSDCIWISSPSFVQEDLIAGTLTTLNVSDLGFRYNEISVISCKSRTLSPAAHHVIGKVQDILSTPF